MVRGGAAIMQKRANRGQRVPGVDRTWLVPKLAEIGAAPAYLFSRTEIAPNPLLHMAQPGRHRWHGLDSERRYRNNPHPVLGPNDVEYAFNRHGYRTAEFDELLLPAQDAVRIVTIGASGALGAGLPQEHSFPALFTEKLGEHLGRPAQNWNLSVGGTSADFVSRMLFSAIHVVKPAAVLLTCFPFYRREMFGETGRIFVSSSRPHWQHRFINPEQWGVDRACERISNPHADLVNFVTNLKVWESLCDRAGVPWLFTTEGYASQIESVEGLVADPRKMVGPGLHALIRQYAPEPATGLARDMLHGGTKPNQEIADRLFERLLEVYPAEVEALRRG